MDTPFSGTGARFPRFRLEWTHGALPVDTDVQSKNGDDVGSFDLLPTTVSVQYHFFEPAGRVRAYLGLGLTQSVFSHEKTIGALDGRRLEIDETMGPSAQAGAAFKLNRTWYVDVSARCFMIEPDATLADVSFGPIKN